MKAYLHLENGKTFPGQLITPLSKEDVLGEIVFFTGMTGYLEVLTDPSYQKQIIVFTYPLIGNYGINLSDFESKRPHVEAVVVYDASKRSYHYEAKYSLNEYLEYWDIPLLTHVDTRQLVKEIRNEGTMLAALNTSPVCPFLKPSDQLSFVYDVSTPQIETYGEGKPHLVLIDFGYKKSILQSLTSRGCKVTIVPYKTSLETIVSVKPDGIVLSNGPGDPKQFTPQLAKIRQLIDRYPTLAICLGHQLVALSYGADTEKLRYGHRGANHPLFDSVKQKVFITSQNHSYVVKKDSLANTPFSIRFTNVNDGSVEGMEHCHKPILSVQFHPEAHPGPLDMVHLFDEYLQTVIKGAKEYA